MTSLLFFIMPIAGAMLLAFGLFQVVMDLRTNRQRKVMDRLNEVRPAERERRVAESLLRQRAADKQGNAMESLLSSFHVVARMQRVLDQADINWSASRVLVNLAAAMLVTVAGLLVIKVSPLAALLAGCGVFVAPLLWLLRKRRKRIKRLVQQLPEVFDMMGQSLRAGHSLAGAIQLISQQMSNPVAGEFGRVFQEQNLGLKIEDALVNMANRVDQMDVRFFVTAVLIQRQTGGDLAEVLDKIAKVIRGRIELFGVVQTLTAEGRLSGWVLLLLPVAVFIGLQFLNPSYARQLTHTDTGRLMLGTAIVMDLMGLAMIKGIMRDKNVTSLADSIKMAQESGVNLIACTMSMDLMGLKREEFIDGVKEGGVALYLDRAGEGNVNLFI